MPTLEFKGKPFVYAHHLSVPFRELVIDEGKSLPGEGGPSLDGNLIIHGDNLEALKALLPKYAGKVDCIFIDPPYNTGNEGWCYNDNVNSPLMKQWLGKAVDGEDLERHDKWACMMWPRLKLLHELLKSGGLFFASIDHNELHNFRCLLGEVFGDEGFIANIAWQKRTSPEARKHLGPAFDSILVFRKLGEAAEVSKLGRTDSQEAEFSNPDNDPNGPWTSSDMTGQNPDPTKRKDQQYKIELASGELVEAPRGRCWGMLEPEFLRLKAEGRIWFGVNGDARPRVKTYLNESDGISSWTWWPNSEVGHNQEAKKEIMQILDSVDFDYPKPVRLLARVIDLATSANSIILDSFAGSGTTAHAVLAANAKDGGNRKFILIETEDYADTLTAERVRRVARGYAFKGAQKTELMREKLSWSKLQKADVLLERVASYDNLDAHKYDRIEKTVKDGDLIVTGIKDCTETAPGLGGSFTYCELGEPMDMARFFDGAAPPAFDQVARYVAYTATGHTLDRVEAGREDMFIGEAGGYRLHLLYRPDATFMRSDAAMLDAAMVDAIADSAKGSNKPILVFATGKYMGQKALSERGITFCQLPYAIHKMLPGDGAGD